ncbi:hypothetical protein T10_4094 [Trichinella papuae]|uniref:Uncharacterized protein n=1 Tax=Trichinella papuae TaxID=268474 RepID=A0A0V1MC99_9BILA|nr:hypothetical protein T10_198 [Trichinella papuae]KRZ78348.1 hypothetical protein T10_4094 [Trichinella papuae]
MSPALVAASIFSELTQLPTTPAFSVFTSAQTAAAVFYPSQAFTVFPSSSQSTSDNITLRTVADHRKLRFRFHL